MAELKSPTPLNRPRVAVVQVETPEQVATMVAGLRDGTGPIAVDAERASGFRYSQAAYLIQLHRRDTPVYLVDPQAAMTNESSNLKLAEFMASLPWILHASTQDLPCLRELGLHPTALIDTELGSRLAGLPRVGLGAVVEHYLGLALAKEHSAVDWSTRPLPESWLDYAALDVEVLPDLAEALLKDLEQKSKRDFAEQEFAHLLNFSPKEKKADRWRSTSGAHAIKSARGLAIARELWEAREALAQKLDVAPGRLIPDSSIVFVASEPPRTKSELAGAKSFNGRASRTYLDTWWQAIQNGLATNDLPALKVPATGIPNHRIWPNRFPEADARLKAAKPIIQGLSEEYGIPAENILTPDFLRQLCWNYGQSGLEVNEFLANLGARPWQVALVSRPLEQALDGAMPAAAREEYADPSLAD